MGKLRKERKKYHLSAVEPPARPDASHGDAAADSATSVSLLPMPDNVFAGLHISYDELMHSLKDPDVISVKSNRTTAGNVLSKKEKKKLRHEAFLKKLEAAYQARKGKKKHKKQKKIVPKNEAQLLLDKLPPLDIGVASSEKTSKKTPGVKKRGIPKAKHRRKNMLQDITLFQSLMENKEYKSNPIQSISSHIQSKVLEEVKN